MLLKTILVSALLLTANCANATPVIKINTKYFTVTGNNSISLHQSLQRNGPVGEDGKHYHALTKWKVMWSYRLWETANRCQLTEVEVHLDINFLLPELQAIETKSTSFKKNWDKYYQALYRHELQHKDYGVQAAVELEKELLAIKKQQNCAKLKDQLEDSANRVLDKYAKIEQEFDRITNHGLNQGVKLQ